jgi:hypothetical protein
MNPVLVRMFEHNRWANLALVDACLGMDRSVVERAVDGTFGAIRPTLAHIAGAEERYLLALEGEQRGAAVPFETTDPSLTDIRIHLDRSGRGLVEVAGRLDGDPTLTGIPPRRALRHARVALPPPGGEPRHRAPRPDRDDVDPARDRAAGPGRLGLHCDRILTATRPDLCVLPGVAPGGRPESIPPSGS